MPLSPDAVTVEEPPKPPASLAAEFSEIWAVIRVLFGKWPVANMVLGVTLVSFAGYGAGQFIPPYFIRTFHLNYAQVGLITGLAGGFSSGLGTLVGGFLTDRLSKRSPRWYALTPAIGLTIATPLYMSIYLVGTWQVAALIFLIPGVFAYTYLGPTFGVVQNMVDTRRRATATAILFFFLNLIALGGGPPLIGWIIDHFASFHFTHPDAPGFFQSVGGFLSAPRDLFQHACPGGIAPKGSLDPALDASCKASLVLATRHGILIAYLFGLWGAVHYYLASFGLTEAMSKARADRGESD
jgi:MFS family permease